MLAVVTFNPSMAQQTSGEFRSGLSSSGSLANRNQPKRTTWQPVRPVQATDELPSPVPRSEPVPTPVPMTDRSSISGERSILQNPGANFFNGPMDGEIVYEGDFVGGHHFQDGYACDAIGGCDGGCDGHCGIYGGCHDGCCAPGAGRAWRPCLTICLPENGWVSFEYLGWWQRGMVLPPLVTTTTGTTLPPASAAGVLGGPTRVLFGGENVLEDGFSGGRLQFGIWLDRCHTWAAAAEYFELGTRSAQFAATSTGTPVLARPFVDVLKNGGENASQVVAYPGFATGSIQAVASSSLAGGGFHLRRQTNCNSGCGRGIFCDGCSTFHSRTDVLFGYRYLQLDETVRIDETTTANGNNFRLHDQFRTFNQFNGFDMGISYERCRGPWSIDLLAKLALGNTRQRVEIDGATVINTDPAEVGGLLTQTSNINVYRRDQFTILPELGARVGYQLTHNLKLKLGYTLIFWSNVARPGEQIDLGVNPELIPRSIGNNPARPEFVFRDTDYWVQGITFGGEFQW
jgi:hypothetical protein